MVTCRSLQKTLYLALTSGDADINMSVIKLEDPSGYGRVIIDNGQVKEIVEQKDCNEAQLLTKDSECRYLLCEYSFA